MALTMNELDARLRAVEEQPAASVSELEVRVAELERRVGGMLSGQVAEISQEERDRRTLSRRPNSYAEAVEFEAAQARQAERDKKGAKSQSDASVAGA